MSSFLIAPLESATSACGAFGTLAAARFVPVDATVALDTLLQGTDLGLLRSEISRVLPRAAAMLRSLLDVAVLMRLAAVAARPGIGVEGHSGARDEDDGRDNQRFPQGRSPGRSARLSGCWPGLPIEHAGRLTDSP